MDSNEATGAVNVSYAHYILVGVLTGVFAAVLTLNNKHSDSASSPDEEKDLRLEQSLAPCPVKEASKKEIKRLAMIELPTLPTPEPETPAESCALPDTG